MLLGSVGPVLVRGQVPVVPAVVAAERDPVAPAGRPAEPHRDRHRLAAGAGVPHLFGPADDTESARLLLGALEAGYTFFDTAAMYGMGHSEELIGRTLSHRRSEFTLASKCGIFKGAGGRTETDGRPKVLKQTCEDSLRRLRTDVIDLYYLHLPDRSVPVDETLRAVEDLARRCHTALCCDGMSRTDIIVTDDGPVVLEVNTIPGLTETSLLPQSAASVGIDFTGLLDRLLEYGLGRQRAS